MDLQIKLNEGTAKPTRAHLWDAGLDLSAANDITLAPKGRGFVGSGISVAIPNEHVGLVIGRSGLGIRQGVTLANCVGVIDSEYRGEIGVGLVNQSDNTVMIRKGDRIAQLLIVPIIIPDVVVVDSLDETPRGASGYGSTGK